MGQNGPKASPVSHDQGKMTCESMVRRRSARAVAFPHLFFTSTYGYEEGTTMTFEEILAQVIAVLQREGRVPDR